MNAPISGPRTPQGPDRRAPRWPEAGEPLGAVLYATVGGLIAWLLVYVLPHIHIAISWH